MLLRIWIFFGVLSIAYGGQAFSADLTHTFVCLNVESLFTTNLVPQNKNYRFVISLSEAFDQAFITREHRVTGHSQTLCTADTRKNAKVIQAARLSPAVPGEQGRQIFYINCGDKQVVQIDHPENQPYLGKNYLGIVTPASMLNPSSKANTGVSTLICRLQ